MTLSDFATFSTAISGLAVTASLIYLALQTHQAAKHTKALIAQGRVASNLDAVIGSSNAAMVSAIITGGGGTPTPERVSTLQFVSYCVMHLQNAEEVFFQHEQGLMSDDHFGSHRAYVAAMFRSPGVRVMWDGWKATRPNIQAKFKAWVDEIVKETPVVLSDMNLDGLVAQIAAATQNNLN